MRVAQKDKIFCDVCGKKMEGQAEREPVITGYFPVDAGGMSIGLFPFGAVDYKDICQTCYDNTVLRAAEQIKEKRP